MKNSLATVVHAQNRLYQACTYTTTAMIPEHEGAEYFAHSYKLNTATIIFRIAKKTPTKTGWFVTIWKRLPQGIIAPYDASDTIDFLVVNILDNNNIIHYVFPKSVLIKQGILSYNSKGGKRGFRLYTPWDTTNSIQAAQTQRWQRDYCIMLNSLNEATIEKTRRLYESFDYSAL